MKTRECKVLVVGAGPGGYVAAIRAGQLGLDTVIVEGDRPGGTCLIRGCIPSKALIHAAGRFEEIDSHFGDGHMGIALTRRPKLDMPAMIKWKDGVVDKLSGGVEMLLKGAGAELIRGWAKFRDAKTCVVEGKDGPVTVKAEHVILATGSVSTELPFMPFEGPVISSTEALDLKDLPRNVVVIGAGYIGLELGIALRKLGSNVTFIEALDRILPLFDKEMTRPVERWLKAHDVPVHVNCKAKGLKEKNGGHAVEYEDKDGKTHTVKADKVLVTVGRKPNTEGWGLENMAIDMDGPFVKVDEQCRTSTSNVWAVGDLIGEPMLEHKAHAQGEMVAEIIAGSRRVFEPAGIPAVCFTEPEVAGVGLTPEEAKAQGIEVKVGRFPFAASGRALAVEAGKDGGFVRVTARADNHVVLGIHAVGAHIAELSGEFAHALEMGARLEDIADTIHVHPTLTESFAEAAMAALGHPIHIKAG
ncbi:MAG: dihydrolipoyl dehydrogenase [Alphaproteobacteria bacterium]